MFLCKLENIGNCDKLLELLKSYLYNWKQYVSINGCSSSIKILHASIPQRSILGPPLLFLIYINDICDDIICDSFNFGDITSMLQQVYNGNIMETANILLIMI